MESPLPYGYAPGKIPEFIKKRPTHLPHGHVVLVNHKWFVEFEFDGKKLTVPVRDDDAWNCDIEAGVRVWLCNFPEDGGWRVLWREGMKRFVKIEIDNL